MVEIRGPIELPAIREDIELHTEDGLTLVGELAMPVNRAPAATLLTLHPLPTAGGFMDSHIYRKAAARLPALADIAVLRFNTRGTSSPRGTSEGSFGEGVTEALDLAAMIRFAKERNLPNLWLVGWSFGTEVLLKHARQYPEIQGFILLSPPLHRCTNEELEAWSGDDREMIVLVPEHDDYLKPDAATERFAPIEHAQLIAVSGGRHLWVGETQTRRVLNEIASALLQHPVTLPTEWSE